MNEDRKSSGNEERGSRNKERGAAGEVASNVDHLQVRWVGLVVNDTPKKSRNPIVKWVERLFVAGAIAFIAYRLGPQIGALVGIGPDWGSAPDYAIVTLDGGSMDSDALRGKVVVLNFWATWCGPCRLEMPSLQSLHEDKAGDGLVVIGLSTDSGPAAEIERFLAEREITYPVGRATARHRSAFGDIPMIPTTFIIDREGVIRHRIEGLAAGPVLRVAAGRLLDG